MQAQMKPANPSGCDFCPAPQQILLPLCVIIGPLARKGRANPIIRSPKPAMSVSGELLELTILVPCLNDAETIARCVRKARGYIESHGVKGEVLVADNGSTDGSQVLAQACGARVIEINGHGYGAAVLGGIHAARGRFVVIGDGDGSYDFSTLGPFLEALRAGYDLVTGNYFVAGAGLRAVPPLHRYVGNPVLAGIGRLLFQNIVGSNPSGGPRAFRRDSILSLGLTSPGVEFAGEMLVKARQRGLRVTEVPAVLAPNGPPRPPHLKSWRDGSRHLRIRLLFSPASLFFYPGITLLALGVALMAWLLPHPPTLRGFSFDLNALVYAPAAIVCGFQAVIFYLFAKTFAIRSGLLPEDRLVGFLCRALRLEVGLAGGALFVLLGLALALAAWLSGGMSYGALTSEHSLRVVVPSATLLILGTQLIFSSCLLGILQLDTRTSYARTRQSDGTPRVTPDTESSLH
jgi:hypothetical protein